MTSSMSPSVMAGENGGGGGPPGGASARGRRGRGKTQGAPEGRAEGGLAGEERAGSRALGRADAEPVVSEAPQTFGERLVVGGHHAALAGRHVLDRMQAEDREVAERADRTILILGAERVGGILDDGEAAVSRLGLNRREITGLTRQVDRDDRLRTWRDPRREQGGVQVQGIAADIPEYG